MKGLIFNHLAEMVEEAFGMEAWDAILQRTDNSGIYIATDTYPDQELMDLVSAAHFVSDSPVNEFVKTFGEYIFPHFRDSHPQFFSDKMTLKSFLLTVDHIIHVEVRKQNVGAILPKLEYKDESDNELTLYYSSPRKLCHLAEGLIAGAAAHFNTRYTLEHLECMHNGAKVCTLQLTILSS